MFAQSRLLAMRKLFFRESWLLNQSAGTVYCGMRSVSGGCAASAGWGDIGSRVGVCSGVVSLFRTARGATSDCEPPFSRMVLKRDLKDAYKSGKFISSKVKRSGGSVEEFNKTTGGAATDEATTHAEE